MTDKTQDTKALDILDELYSFFAIEDVHDAMGEWTKTYYERPDTGEAVFEHYRMTRKEIEEKLRALNALRAALQPKPSVDVEALKKVHSLIKQCHDEDFIPTHIYSADELNEMLSALNFPSLDLMLQSSELAEKKAYDRGVIDGREEQGHLNQGWRDIESAPLYEKMYQENKDMRQALSRFDMVRDRQKEQAGFDKNVSFDVIWQEMLDVWNDHKSPPPSEGK